jgi:hypothetical protein
MWRSRRIVPAPSGVSVISSVVEPGGTASLLSQPQVKPGKLVRWSSPGGFPGWEGTTITWEIVPAKAGGQEVTFSHAGWPAGVPAAELASVNYTWGLVVGRLKKHVETGGPVPFFG